MELRYYINETLIQEPIGMETFKETLKRTQYHGVVKSVSIEPLEFYGNAYDIITAAYATDLDSVLRFSVEKKCSDSDVFIEEYAGMIDLSTYDVTTGSYCSVRCNVGDITDEEIKFNNRSETVVNIEQLTDMDGGVLSAYDNLNLDLTIPSKKILFQDKIETKENTTNTISKTTPSNFTNIGIKPKLEINVLSEFGVIYTTNDFEEFVYASLDNQQFINTESKSGVVCYYKFDLTIKNNKASTLYVSAHKTDGTTFSQIGTGVTLAGAITSSFIIEGNITLPNLLDHRIFINLYQTTGGESDPVFNFDFTSKSGSFVNYNHLEELSATTAKLSLIHETLSRTAEIISGMSVVSNYYAREDSEVNQLSSGFGDGSLKSLVTGMKLRNGVQTDGTLPVLQSSFKDLFLNLNAIDNIGWGVEHNDVETYYTIYSIVTDTITFGETYDNLHIGDIIKSIGASGLIDDLKIRIVEHVSIDTVRVSADVSGYPFISLSDTIEFIHKQKYVRIEPFEYFYDPTNVALTINYPDEIRRKAEMADIYTRLTVGYEKYADTEDVNSIDTFHTVRNYTTRLKATDKENKQVSKFVACPYAIEFTRRKALDKTTEDWKYDESTFVLELYNNGSNYLVKQGMSNTNGTVISPETMYNVALSPARNAIRHIAMMFGFNHSGLNLYITGFTGNATAEGIRTVGAGDYLDDSAGGSSLTENEPLPKVESPLKAERIEFEYPLTLVQWEALKLAPYKIITVDGEDAYIDEVTREVTTGLAKFKLIPKNE